MAIISTKQPVQVCQLFVPYPDGTIDNCRRYKPDANECDICKHGYYFNGKICAGMSSLVVPIQKARLKIACGTNPMQMNVKDAIHMVFISTKQPVQVCQLFVPYPGGTIDNCLLYKRNANECLGCNFGHHLSEKTCASMDSILFPIEDRNE